MGLIGISSLELIGSSQAMLGGRVFEGSVHVGDLVSDDVSKVSDTVMKIRAYGRDIDEVPSGMSAGFVVGVEFAKHITLGAVLRVGS